MSDPPTKQRLDQVIDQALRDRRCVQVWLGYGETLFIGFGDTIIPRCPVGQSHPVPSYELHTTFADWTIKNDQGIIASRRNERSQAADAANQLVGCRVIGWTLPTSPTTLTVLFERDLILQITAWAVGELNLEEQNEDAWTLRISDGTYFAVSCSGKLSSEKDTNG